MPVALSSLTWGRSQPPPTARLIPAGRLLRAAVITRAPTRVDGSPTTVGLHGESLAGQHTGMALVTFETGLPGSFRLYRVLGPPLPVAWYRVC